MRTSRAALLLAAIAFGTAGVLTSHFFSPADLPLIGQPDETLTSGFWQTSLPDLSGQNQDLAQWQGKVVVANFWATWCPPCRREIPGFIRVQQRYAQAGVRFIGLAVDERDDVVQFTRQAGFNYPILLASEATGVLFHAVGNDMGGLPYTVVFDKQGKAVATFTGEVAEARLEALLKPLL